MKSLESAGGPDRRGVLLAGLSCLVGGLSLAAAPRDHGAGVPGLESDVPSTLGPWSQVDGDLAVPASTEGVAAEIYQDILTRAYAGPGGRTLMLVIAYGGDQSDSMRAHRQETCYRAQGFEVRDVVLGHAALGASGSLPVARFEARLNSRRECVSYWMTMGAHVVRGRIDRLVAQVREGFFGTRPDGFLVRLSTLGAEPSREWPVHDAFASALLGSVRPDLSRRLAGLSSAAGA